MVRFRCCSLYEQAPCHAGLPFDITAYALLAPWRRGPVPINCFTLFPRFQHVLRKRFSVRSFSSLNLAARCRRTHRDDLAKMAHRLDTLIGRSELIFVPPTVAQAGWYFLGPILGCGDSSQKGDLRAATRMGRVGSDPTGLIRAALKPSWLKSTPRSMR
jgi:hypothetical protein